MSSILLLPGLWKRLKKNKGALFGLIIIIDAVLMAIFAYYLAPDSSPNADLQTVKIQAKKPGYQQLFLKIPDIRNNNANWFQYLLSGRQNQYRLIPITVYTIKG